MKPFSPDIAPAAHRAEWERVKQRSDRRSDLQYVRTEAARLAGGFPPALRLSDYLVFFATGERFAFESRYYQRRHELALLVVAECVDYSGAYLGAIADRVWQICEETSWCIPASAVQQDNLPEDTPPQLRTIPGVTPHPFPELMACETGAVLAEVLHLLGPELARISGAIQPRVLEACRKHVFNSFLANDHYGWLQGRNNWAPWCASSILLAACRIEPDTDRRERLVGKAILVCGRFLAHLPEDGYGEEGPSYAYVAMRALTYAAEMLRAAGNRTDFYGQPAFRRLCDAFVEIHLEGATVANFGACSPSLRVQPAALERLAERLDSPAARVLAHRYTRLAGREVPRAVFSEVANAGSLLHMVRDLFWLCQGTDGAVPVDVPRKLSVEFPHSQVAILRQRDVTPHGWTVALRGGHNGVSHNHNDVGHCILLHDGRVVIADVGRETYHRDSWGPRRYEAWNLRGSGHNAPLINGYEQQAGREHGARAARLSHGQAASSYSLDLTAIYPAAASVREVGRMVELERSGRVACTVRDRVLVDAPQVQVDWHLYTPWEPHFDSVTRLVWPGVGEGPPLWLVVQAPDARLEVTRLDLTDPWLREAWGAHLWHIHISSTTAGGEWAGALSFTAETPA